MNVLQCMQIFCWIQCQLFINKFSRAAVRNMLLQIRILYTLFKYGNDAECNLKSYDMS